MVFSGCWRRSSPSGWRRCTCRAASRPRTPARVAPGRRHAVVRVAAGVVRRRPSPKVFWLSVIVLAGDVVLVAAAAVIVPGHAGVGRGALRPVDPAVLDHDLLGRVVTGGQPGDERRDGPVPEIDRARSAKCCCRCRARRARPGSSRVAKSVPPCEVVLEGEADRRAVGLEAAAAGGRLAERSGELAARACRRSGGPGVNGLVADRTCRRCWARALLLQRPGRPVPDSSTSTWKSCLLPRNAMSVGKLRSLGEDFDLVPVGHDDVLAVAGVVEHIFTDDTRGCRPSGLRQRTGTNRSMSTVRR